ncbi:hypothetical protein EKO27_g4381 [Xylaria grammica]|uniref:Ketoreductase (KR) domain-containing protein n=1 Tax=Xylaria grammica TaxID=363999 RepID=A0A439D8H7_9PEZI|nr:hypothetical protein EKO27_g4381 [Xylaria grammica]
MFRSKLSGSRVLVIGGTSGMGFGVSKACVYEGSTVIIVSSKESRVASAISRLKEANPNAQVEGRVCNVGNADDLESNVAQLFDSIQGPLDHIVFTAGDELAIGPVSGLSVPTIIQGGTVRFIAPLIIAKYAAERLTKSRSSSYTIVGGERSKRPTPGWAIPASYIAGLNGMVRALAMDLKPIRVNLVHPGAVKTEMWETLPEDVRNQAWEDIARRYPTGIIGSPDDVAEAFIYLMKDANSTGSVVHTNGGSLLV